MAVVASALSGAALVATTAPAYAAPVPASCGEPFVETFGTGTGSGEPLPDGQTDYFFESGGNPDEGPTNQVNDGEYALPSAIVLEHGNWWHLADEDRTPGDVDGRMMLVNASFLPGIFYQEEFTGLVAGADYDFSSWIANARQPGSDVLPNVTYRVIDTGTGDEIASVDTGDLPDTDSLQWQRFGTRFTATGPTVRLELVNNARGGNGNDLVIDDISFAIACDFGDAPDSYGTTIAADGAMHLARGATLGTLRDSEADGRPSPAADGDDTTGEADEDGITGPLVVTFSEETTVAVSATNDTDDAYVLAGWIDLDGNGGFDANELASTDVPAGSSTAEYLLTFPPATAGEATIARFRLLPAGADIEPTGAAASGEVEDYPVAVTAPPALQVTISASSEAEVAAGDVIDYTITLTNTGTGDFTASVPARVLNDLADLLDDASLLGESSATSSDGNTVPAPLLADGTLSWAGPIPAGESVTLAYSAFVRNDGDHDLVNTVTPVCSDGIHCGTAPEPIAVLLPHVTPEKSSDPAPGTTVEFGSVLTYTVTFTNEGQAPGPVDAIDNLSGVLDDAVLSGDPISDTAGITVLVDEDTQTLRIAGDLPAGEVAAVTYQVTVRADDERGDDLLRNVLLGSPPFMPAPGCDDCPGFAAPTTEHPVRTALLPSEPEPNPPGPAPVPPGSDAAPPAQESPLPETGIAPWVALLGALLLGLTGLAVRTIRRAA